MNSLKTGAELISFIEEKYGTQLPERLKTFITKESNDYQGRYAYELPEYLPEVKLQADFFIDAVFELFDDIKNSNEYNAENLFPIALLDNQHLFAVNTNHPELPVFMFIIGSGFLLFKDRFEDMLSALLKRGEKTPYGKLSLALSRAKNAFEAQDFPKVVSILSPLLSTFSVAFLTNSSAIEACLILGQSLEKLQQPEEALAAYEKASLINDSHDANAHLAAAHLCRLYYEHYQDYEKMHAVAQRHQSYTPFSNMYSWFHLRRYLLLGSIYSNNVKSAVSVAHSLYQALYPKYHGDIEIVQNDFRGYVDNRLPNGIIAIDLLNWFKTYHYSLNSQQHKENRIWWQSLEDYPNQLKESLLYDVGANEKEGPSEQQLAAILAQTALNVRNCKLNDIKFISAFKHLRLLTISGNKIEDISPLQDHTRLIYLDASDNLVSDLTALSSLTRLQEADLNENRIKNLKGIQNLSQLREFKLSENIIADITSLATLTELEELDISDNQIKNLAPLAGCSMLQQVDCCDNPSKQAYTL